MSAQPADIEEPRALGEVERAIEEFFVARAPKKDSEHTRAAYANDLDQVLGEVARVLGVARSDVTLAQIRDLKTMRRAFAAYSGPRAKSSVRRGHSTWSVFFTFLASEDLVDGSPMPGIHRPKAAKRIPKGFSPEEEQRIIAAVLTNAVTRRDPWPELDAAALLTLLLTAIRTNELLAADISDVTPTEGNERIRVGGKGDKDRVVPLERLGIEILEVYLWSRLERFPDHARRGLRDDTPIWQRFKAGQPLIVDRKGERMKRGTLQYLVQLVYKTAGVEAARAQGALVHALRHTTATRLAENGVTGMDLMVMLGHASLQTVQIYLNATAEAIRAAAGKNAAYEMIAAGRAQPPPDPVEEPQE